MEKIWKTRRQALLEFKESFKAKKIYNTGFPFFDDYVTKPSIISIVGSPGVGKTLLKDQLCLKLISNNFYWLDFQLEMPVSEILYREFIYQGILNDKEQRIKYIETTADMPWFIVDDPVSSKDISRIANDFCETFNVNKGLDLPKGVIAIDHALIVGDADGGKNIASLMKELVKLKKNGFYVILLSQLNREVDDPSRTKQSSSANYITRRDVYMSDALIQYSDIVIALDAPLERGISLYGTMSEPIDNDNIIISLLKNRHGGKKIYKYMLVNLKYEFQKILEKHQPRTQPEIPVYNTVQEPAVDVTQIPQLDF